jgi:hypothetical protein
VVTGEDPPQGMVKPRDLGLSFHDETIVPIFIFLIELCKCKCVSKPKIEMKCGVQQIKCACPPLPVNFWVNSYVRLCGIKRRNIFGAPSTKSRSTTMSFEASSNEVKRRSVEAKSFDSRTRCFRSICDICGNRCRCGGLLYFAC